MLSNCVLTFSPSAVGQACRQVCTARSVVQKVSSSTLPFSRQDRLVSFQATVNLPALRTTRVTKKQTFSTMAKYSQDDLGKYAYEIVPQLSSELSKGMSGKVATIGGCREYTGAPYFASMTCLRVGADLSHVFCTEGAATVIKSYSPELIVHPYLPDSNDYDEDLPEDKRKKIVDKSLGAVLHWLERFDTVIIGPGLGRDEMAIKWMRENNKHMVIDADGLYIVTKNLDLVKGYKKVVLTPNKGEFTRLAKELNVDVDDKDRQGALEQIAAKLEGPVVVQKGAKDGITDGKSTIYCEGGGSKRRAGGQGDVMTGAIATHLAWALTYQEMNKDSKDFKFPGGLSPLMLAAWGGCHIARVAAKHSFAEKHRSMVAGDVIEKLGQAMHELYGAKAE